MSFSEKAQLKLFLASNTISKGKGAIVIGKARSEITGNVTSFSVAPFVPNKSDWFQQSFANSNGENGEKGGGSSGKTFMNLAATVVGLTNVNSGKTIKIPAPSVPEGHRTIFEGCIY